MRFVASSSWLFRFVMGMIPLSLAASAVSAQVAPIYGYVVPHPADPLLTNLTIPASAATQGMWSKTWSWPLVGLHLTVMPDGRVISFGTPDGQGVQDGRTLDLWDPKQGFTPASHLQLSNGQTVDSFCGTATMLPTGLLLVSGGGSSGDGYTSFGSTLVNPNSSTAARASSNMAAQRWYSTMITLADGRAMITGGGTPYAIVSAYANPTGTEPNISETPEVYNASTGWSSLMGANSADAFGPINNRAWYPRQWVAPNGNVFGISTEKMWLMDPTGTGSIRTLGTFKTTVNNTTLPNVGPTSTAVMYDTGKILQVGGNGYNNGYQSPSSPYATVFDITQPTAPVVKDTARMSNARQWPSSTVLPDGKVLVTGGTTFGDNAGTNAVYAAEIWNPATGTWTVGASAANYRGYHSAAALLPDGVVLSTGGGVPGPVTNLNAEIYYPPYLFAAVPGGSALAARPQIVSMTNNGIDYGQTMSVQMADAGTIAEVSLIGLTSVTHSFNTGQRRMKLAFTQNGTRLSVVFPASGNIAPPGYYQVSVLNTSRVPSTGAIVALHASLPVAADTTALLPVDAAVRSFASQSHPGSVIRHSYFLGYISPINPLTAATGDRDDSSFYTRPGNANAACYSFESKNYPGYFLRHQNFRLLLNQNDQSGLFAQDSTFCAVAGLSGSGFSLQSFNYPDHYVHSHSGSDVWIDVSDGTAAFAQDASFFQTEQYLPVDANLYSFASQSAFGELVRHANFIGYVTSINGASLPGDIADASFHITQGNAGSGCYSIQASNYPGYYLRQNNGTINLNANDGSAAFAASSTFCLATGLSGSGLSLQLYNTPGTFLRQTNGTVIVSPNDNSAGFAADATFALNPAPQPR